MQSRPTGLFLLAFWVLTWCSWIWLALGAPADSPDWLLRTREVCFATFSDGLPQAEGWVSLAAPLPMLLALLILCGSEIKQQWNRVPFWLRLLLVGLPLAASLFAGIRVQQGLALRAVLASAPEKAPLTPDYPRIDVALPEFRLTDQHGKDFGLANLRGQVTVLTFAYAHCETVCPGLISTLRALPPEVPRVVVTLDPWRDTCGTLQGLANHWSLDGPVLSGPPEEVERLTTALGIPIERDLNTGEIFHPALILVVDARGHAVYQFASPNVDWLIQAVTWIRQ